MGTETKANAGRMIGTVQKHFKRNEEGKSQAEIMMSFCKVTLNMSVSPAAPSISSTSCTSATPETASPTPPLPPLPQAAQHEDGKNEDLGLPWWHSG